MRGEADIDRRGEILRQAAAYVLECGLGDLSLRPLAAALGTSGRMLIYYFGSKDEMVVDILAEIRRRKYAELDVRGGDGNALRRYWDWATSAEGQRYLRVVYEVYGLSLREPERYRGFLATESQEHLDLIGEGLREAGVAVMYVETLSTYTFAAMRGLELDLLATGDVGRADGAFAMFEADLARRTAEALARGSRKKERR